MPSAEVRNAPKRSFGSISREWASLAALASVIPVYFLVSHFANDARALVAGISSGIVVLVIRYFWDLNKQVWFWFTIAFLVGIHVLLLLLLPPPAKQWNHIHWNRVQMLPFGVLDFYIAYAVIRSVEKILQTPAKTRDGMTS